MKALTKQDDLILITEHLSHVASIFASNKIQQFYADKSIMTVYCHFMKTENNTTIWSPNIFTFNLQLSQYCDACGLHFSCGS